MPSTSDTTRRPWNLGCFVEHESPFEPKHISAIHTCLQHEGRTGDLALFNTTIDSKLCGCNLLRLINRPGFEKRDIHRTVRIRSHDNLPWHRTGRTEHCRNAAGGGLKVRRAHTCGRTRHASYACRPRALKWLLERISDRVGTAGGVFADSDASLMCRAGGPN
jgi:hypothetical protein